MQTKTFDLKLKEASEDENKPSIVAYASTFDREPDSYGDVVAKGAFANFIERIKETGEKIPLLFGHRTDDPMMNIGVVTAIEEDEKGLKVNADFDMENPNGAYVYKLVKEGRLYKLSFAYEVLDEAPVELENGIKANELREMNVYEVSLVPIPANQHAQVIEAKKIISDEKCADDTEKNPQVNDGVNGKTPEEQQSEELKGQVLKTLIEIELNKEN